MTQQAMSFNDIQVTLFEDYISPIPFKYSLLYGTEPTRQVVGAELEAAGVEDGERGAVDDTLKKMHSIEGPAGWSQSL